MDQEIKREIIMENYLHPYHKEETNDSGYIKVNSNNESCIDNIDLYIKIENDKIEDIKFAGEACAISTASTSIMIKELIGKTSTEALKYVREFEQMVDEKKYDESILGESLAFDDIFKQKNRKHCATLPYKGLKKVLEQYSQK